MPISKEFAFTNDLSSVQREMIARSDQKRLGEIQDSKLGTMIRWRCDCIAKGRGRVVQCTGNVSTGLNWPSDQL